MLAQKRLSEKRIYRGANVLLFIMRKNANRQPHAISMALARKTVNVAL
jgi:hypothetical protein